MNKEIINVYTDGSCRGNGYSNSCGGWGFVVIDGNNNELYSSNAPEKNTTNNRMELTAVIEAINWIKNNYEEDKYIFKIYTDSAYLHNCISQKWYINWKRNGWKNSKKEPVKNKDLWELLIPYFNQPYYQFYKVKGHNGQKWNEYADKLATSAADTIK